MKKLALTILAAGSLALVGTVHAKQDVTNWSKNLPEVANGNLTPAGQAVYNQGQFNKLATELGSEAAAIEYLNNLPAGYELKFNFPVSKESPIPTP